MKAGETGMFGGGIYFASTRAIARHKAARDRGPEARMSVAKAQFGKALVLDGAQTNLTLSSVRAQAADSVKGRSRGDKDSEFVVWDRNSVAVLSCEIIPQDASLRRVEVAQTFDDRPLLHQNSSPADW
jgi:hypothetical protein